MPKPKISIEQCEQIRQARKEGKYLRAVARALGISLQSTWYHSHAHCKHFVELPVDVSALLAAREIRLRRKRLRKEILWLAAYEENKKGRSGAIRIKAMRVRRDLQSAIAVSYTH